MTNLRDSTEIVPDPIKVLLVEDFRMSVRFLSQALRASRSSIVYTAESGSQALQLLYQVGPVDMLLVDLFMSIMNGVELIKKVRELEGEFHWKRQTIVAMSAEDTLKNDALEAGADEFLDKFDLPIKAIIRIIDGISAKKKAAVDGANGGDDSRLDNNM